jgi:HEAT repeat protein
MAQGWTLSCARARILLVALFLAPVCAKAATTPQNLEALRDRDSEVRAKAMDALMKSGPRDVPELVRWVSRDGRRRVVSRILAQMGPKAIPPLMKLLDDPELRIRAGGLLFGFVGPGQSRLAPQLLDCVRSKPEVKHYCGQSLVKAMSPKADGQTRGLLAALKDKDADVRYYAAASLGQAGIGGRGVPSALAALLKDPDPRLRAVAVEALGRLGSKARAAAPALEEAAAREENEQLRGEVLEALRKVNG